MSSISKIGVWVAVAAVSSVLSVAGMNHHAFAATSPEQSPQASQTVMTNIPLEIEPVCSDGSAQTAQWKVTNKNVQTVTISWNNFENNLSSTYNAPTGVSTMITGYNPSDPNNTTRFMSLSDTNQTNATKAACQDETVPSQPTQPTTPACVDGSIQDNLVTKYISTNTVEISTLNGAPLCHDVQLYFSSYVMPRNFDNQGFYGNPTATPQNVFDSYAITLKEGTDGHGVYTITYPVCENVQFDIYYAPEITLVGPNGHGTQNILSNIALRDSTSCDMGNGNTGGNPGNGGGNTTPTTPPTTTPETPAPTTPVEQGNGAAEGTPTELPHTGPSASPYWLFIGIIAAAFVYAVTYRLMPKQEN